MSRYTGYNQRGFANSTVAVTRATSDSSTPVDITGDESSTKVYLPLNDNTNDASGNFTISGTASVSSAEAKFGGGSALFNSSSTYLTASGSISDMAFTGAFTIEMWVYQTATPSGSGYTIAAVHNSSGWLWQLKPTYSRFWVNSSTYARFEETLTNNTWHHLAVVREAAGGVVKFYLNGTLKATSGSTPSTMVSARDLYIGAYRSNSNSQNFQGYIDDFRILDGVALYTSNFTPPAAALGIHQIDPVSLYLPFDSDVNDDSSFSHTVTASGSAAISSTQTKFGSNSLFIDASGDYLSIPSNSSFRFEEGDFTIEMFIRPDDVSTTDQVSNVACIIDHDATASTSGAWFALHQQNQALVLGANNGTLITTSNCLSATTWHHVVVVRSGSTTTIYCDGVNVGSASDTHDYDDSTSRNLYIGKQNITFGGGNAGGTRRFDGYIDDLRISKGVARYTKNFVPPSQAVGATLNGTNETNTTTDFTSVYLPFDSDVNDDGPNSLSVTAAGGAGISSAQSKFGGYSALFDGTDDALVVSNAGDDFDFGTGDFTIELFFYQTSNSSRNDITGTYSGASTGWGISTNTSLTNEIILYFGNSTILSSGASAYDLNTWHHLAIARSGSSIKMFIDGSAVATATNTTNVNSGYNLRVGAVPSSVDATFLFFSGYIDDYRILKGYAKYTADFVPPTSAVGTSVSETVNDLSVLYMPFDADVTTSTASGDTVLYLPFDSDTDDDSSESQSVTNSGVTISSTQAKFGSYSGYFSGADYAQVAYDSSLGDDFIQGDFTMKHSSGQVV